MFSLIVFWIWIFIVCATYLYDTYIHGRFRKTSFLMFVISIVSGLIIYPFFSDLLFRVYFVGTLAFCASFLFLARFHRSFLESSAITNIVSTRALERVESDTYEFINTIDQDVVILMRVYNEQQMIWRTLKDIHDNGFRHIVIVDDGSTDMSMRRVDDFLQKFPTMRILRLSHDTRRGWWAANRTLFSLVTSHTFPNSWFVTFDADGQMQASDIFRFVDASGSHPETQILLGSRFVPDGSTTNLSFIRKCILLGSRFVTYIFSRIWISDPHNWFRMIHRDLFDQIQIKSDDMYYASEIIHTLQDRDWRYTEVPVHINYSSYSYQKGQKNRNALRILLHFMYEHIFCR